MYMPYFQQQPWRALDFMDERQSDGYEYGGALLPLYLVGAYAPDDGPVMMRQIWQESRQPWSAQDNDPSYYDGIAEVVAARGGPARMEDIFVDFSEARFFVGNNDDQAHIPQARRMWDAEPTVSQRHGASELPIVAASPSASQRPSPFGANYVRLDNLGEQPLRVEFDGDDATRWEARVVLFGGGVPTASQTIALNAGTFDGGLTVTPAGHASALLVVANLGPEDYDPNSRRWTPSGYSYGVREVPAAPALERAEPGQLERGVDGQAVALVGIGFVASERFAVELQAEGVTVVSAEVEAHNVVRLIVDVDEDAALGPVAVRVVNDEESEAMADGLLEIVEPEVELGGCECRGAAGGDEAGLLALLGLGLLCGRRRVRG
jgi:MYXO-CTERM domain-containing protein